MKLIMQHDSGITKKVKGGFSWTTFFFGLMPSLIRWDLISALKIFFIGNLTFGIYTLVRCFSINKDYKESLLLKGFKVVGQE